MQLNEYITIYGVCTMKLPDFIVQASVMYFMIKIYFYSNTVLFRPPLWSSGQSFWLQIQRPGFDSRCYQVF
jgi:hypothetical protein